METDVAGAFKGPPPSPASRQLSRHGFGLIAKCPATVPLGVPMRDSAKTVEFSEFPEGVPQTVPLSCLYGAVGVPPVPFL